MAVDSDDGDEEEWRYSLSDLEDEDESDGSEDADSEESEGLSAGVAGTFDLDGELEAGEIDRENALFVAVGVILAVAFIAGFVLLP